MRRRGQVISRGPSKWLLRVYQGETSGKKRYASKTVEGSRKDAQKALDQFFTELHQGKLPASSDQATLGEFLSFWFETKHDISERTRRDYVDLLARHVLQDLGGLKLTKLEPHHIQACYSAMIGKGLSPRTVRLTHAPLRQALEQAFRWGKVTQNVADLVTLPKSQRKEMKVLTTEQAQRVLAVGNPLFTLLLTTGLRPAEALALQWGDLDLNRESLTVARALVQTEPGKWVPGATKTSGSRRQVALPEIALRALRGMARFGPWIFQREDGTILNPENAREQWYRLLKRLGLPRVRLYDLRHTHVTQLLQAGVHPKVAAARVGHSSTTLTLDTYSHVLPEMAKQAAHVMDRLAQEAAR